MIEEIYENILTHSKLSEIINLKLRENIFEEIPIIDRYKDVYMLEKYITVEGYSACLMNISLFLLYNIKIQLKKRLNEKDYFVCITLCDPDVEVTDVGFNVPNIFIGHTSNITYLSQEINFSLKNDIFLNRLYGSLIDDNMYSCYKTVSKNDYEDVNRIYIIPKRW